ncbi:hypothetical protein TNCT_219041 [Trichonephila clavata]|uniref:Uncharacterized protein n=1 Tax=Trichonephila clavata TaxID=2740835 RepID=A0A8X6LFD4_TRICU|nr:hypothetical protein TNCT_219041 [Trichonephila clavata]
MEDKYSLRMKRISLAIADTSFAFGMFILAGALVRLDGASTILLSCHSEACTLRPLFFVVCFGVSRLRNHLEQNVPNANTPPYLYPSGFAGWLCLENGGTSLDPRSRRVRG